MDTLSDSALGISVREGSGNPSVFLETRSINYSFRCVATYINELTMIQYIMEIN